MIGYLTELLQSEQCINSTINPVKTENSDDSRYTYIITAYLSYLQCSGQLNLTGSLRDNLVLEVHATDAHHRKAQYFK